MALRIEDYAPIGDCQTIALVGRDGSIDWLCLPRFDSGACFAALLGTPDHGRWSIGPAGGTIRSTRTYLGETLILETLFETADGTFAILDFMPIRQAAPMVVRIVEGRRGRVPVRMELTIRFEYGSVVPWVQRKDGTITAVAGPDAIRLRSPTEMHGEKWATVSEFSVAAGERLPFVLTWYRSYDAVPAEIDAEEALRETTAWWEAWSGRCRFHGERRELVIRSLITLKALTYAPSGGIVAAATTSLPEHIGGVRNWDYRFCWLRDATLSLFALIKTGYLEEACAWQQWLQRAVAGDTSGAQIMYGVGGERRLAEYEVPWLPGYEGSRPVRVGNAAHAQFQLDVYGEVLNSLFQAAQMGVKPEAEAWSLQRALIEQVERVWEEPDEGIWEVRGPRRHFTHSKAMAWVALDRGVRSAELFGLDAPLERWKAVRAAIHERVCREGFHAGVGAFVQEFGSDRLDASALILPLAEFLPPDDPRVRSTVEAIEKHLMRNGFVLRYDTAEGADGLPPGEGAFLPCSFWLVNNYVLLGEREKARALFERLAALGNDVGLLSEEYDPLSGRLLGNFPQAFTHVGLVIAAINLAGMK